MQYILMMSTRKFTSMLLILVLSLFIVAVRVNCAQAEDKGVKSLYLDDLLKSSLPLQAQWQLSAIDLESGKELVSVKHSKDAALVPGSLMKLFVSAAALDRDARLPMSFDTTVATDGTVHDGTLKGNIYIIGSGNALLSVKELNLAVAGLHSLGIRIIDGDIIADDSLFEATNLNKTRWIGPAYASQGALGLDLHTVSVTASADKANFSVEPPNDSVHVAFSTDGQAGIRRIDDVAYVVTKSGLSNSTVSKRFGLNDPALYAAGTFKTLLRAAGISHSGNIKKGKAPVSSRVLSRMKAPALAEIIANMNQHSLNVVADNVLLKLGAEQFGAPGTRVKGVGAVKDFFVREPVLADQDVTIFDGSGLSSENRVSAATMTRFFYAASKKAWFRVLYDSIPRAGLDGAINPGYRNESVRVKTGQLPDSYSLAGYGEDKYGKKIAFCYMVNGPGAGLMNAVQASGITVLRTIFSE